MMCSRRTVSLRHSPKRKLFKTLKGPLQLHLSLALPNFSIPFILEIDPSGTGLGAVLLQNGKAIAYYSSAFFPKNAALSTYEKEALAIIEAWRHYFLGHKRIIRTYHQSIKFMTDQKLNNAIQHKLVLKLLEFDYQLEYKKGKANIMADALSRKYQLLVISLFTHKWIEQVKKSYLSNPKCKTLMENLLLAPNHTIISDTIQAGIIRHKGEIFVGDDIALKTKLLTALDSSALGGHSA